MTEYREGDAVILCEMGPVTDGIARLTRIASVSDGIASVEGKSFRLDGAEPWDIPNDPKNPIRYILKPDTPANRRLHGISLS